jgi:hypothetical protein
MFDSAPPPPAADMSSGSELVGTPPANLPAAVPGSGFRVAARCGGHHPYVLGAWRW